MPEVSVEYEVLLGVKVDTDTGQVTRVVVHTADFNCMKPDQVFGDDYLDLNSPLARRAIEIARGVEAADVTDVPYTMKPEWCVACGRPVEPWWRRGVSKFLDAVEPTTDNTEGSTDGTAYARP